MCIWFYVFKLTVCHDYCFRIRKILKKNCGGPRAIVQIKPECGRLKPTTGCFCHQVSSIQPVHQSRTRFWHCQMHAICIWRRMRFFWFTRSARAHVGAAAVPSSLSNNISLFIFLLIRAGCKWKMSELYNKNHHLSIQITPTNLQTL